MAPSHHLARSVGGEVAQLEVMASSENRGRNAVTTGFLIPVTTGQGLEGFEYLKAVDGPAISMKWFVANLLPTLSW